MRSISARRLGVCIATAAALVAAAAPATASAKGPKTDRLQQCAGIEKIVGHGSTFQNPAQVRWNAGFKSSSSSVACNGTQGAKKVREAEYRNTAKSDRGSGACLKSMGAEKHAKEPEFEFCATDEAPNATQKKEIEEASPGGEADNLETIPVLQGAEAVIVHLPEGCKASSEITVKGKPTKLGRLVFDEETIQEIYRGTVNNWEEVEAKQGAGHGSDKVVCGEESKKKEPIERVVRTDHSGTTHIFKAFLGVVNDTKWVAEPYEESYFGNSTGCGKPFPSETEEFDWTEVSEGCQNQRWPKAAHVVRNEENGNPGVVKLVNTTPSSVGYADLAVAAEYGFFSAKEGTNIHGEHHVAGGENKKGEQNARFWAEVQNGTNAGLPTYTDPSTKGDTESEGSSNCKNTHYIEGTESSEEEFPPATTRDLWNKAKAAKSQEHYAICGLTYDLAFRQYHFFLKGSPFESEGVGIATTVHDYLQFEVSSKGGGKEIKNHDYEALPKEVVKKAEAGISEISNEETEEA